MGQKKLITFKSILEILILVSLGSFIAEATFKSILEILSTILLARSSPPLASFLFQIYSRDSRDRIGLPYFPPGAFKSILEILSTSSMYWEPS